MSTQEFINLLEINGFIKRGDYTLKSGLKSKFYIDLRNIGSNKELRKSFVALVKPLLAETSADTALLGVPDGATSLAAYLSDACDKDHLILPKQVKDYGYTVDTTHYRKHQIILIEDVVSTGSSLVEVIQRLEGYKASILKIIPIIDRNMGGREKIQAEFPHLKYEPVITIDDIEKMFQ